MPSSPEKIKSGETFLIKKKENAAEGENFY